jgi:hypothetical protein
MHDSTSGTRSSLAPKTVGRPVYACELDDTSFIEGGKDRWSSRAIPDQGIRVALLFLTSMVCDADWDDQNDVLRDWLEGTAENDVWLWVDDDEKKLSDDSIRELHFTRYFPEVTHYVLRPSSRT